MGNGTIEEYCGKASGIGGGGKAESAAQQEEIKKIIPKLIEENYAIIYVTENVSIKAEKYLNKLSKDKIPAIVTIPSNTGSLNYGEKRIKDMVQKAVGIEIHFKEDN